MRFFIALVLLLFEIGVTNLSFGADSGVVKQIGVSPEGTVASLSYCHDGICDEPERNRCTFDKNTVPWVEQRVVDLRKGVDGATLYHLKEHYGSVSDYTLPGDFFWRAIGLSELFDKPKECCGACNANCLKPIVLKKFQVGSAGAMFNWITGNGQGSTIITSKASVQNIRITITHKNTVKGEVVIWADGAEYFFNDGYGPELKYELLESGNQWKTWFFGRISCFAPGREVVVLNSGRDVAVPNLDLLLIDKTSVPTPPSP
jgi:hypothetical protein